MLRASICAVVVLSLVVVSQAKADDSTTKSATKKHHHTQATITKVDSENGTVTVSMNGKGGKQTSKTLHVADGVKYFDASGDAAKLADFRAGDDVVIMRKGGKITEMRKQAEATITKVDAKDGTLTVKMMDKTGKEVEKTFHLTEESEYIDSTGRVAALDVFQSGDYVLLIEENGTIKEMKKGSAHNKAGENKVSEK
jgi:hypothetical protein